MNDQNPPANGACRRKPPRKRAPVPKPYEENIPSRAQARNEVAADLRLHWATRVHQARINNTIKQAGPVSDQELDNPTLKFTRTHSTGLPPRPVPYSVGRKVMMLTPNLIPFHHQLTAASLPGPSTSRSPDEVYDAGSTDESNFGVSGERAGLLETGPCEDFGVFEQAMELPAWMNANRDDSCGGGGDSFGDTALPCMDIEGIEGVDGEWLYSDD